MYISRWCVAGICLNSNLKLRLMDYMFFNNLMVFWLLAWYVCKVFLVDVLGGGSGKLVR